MIKSSNAPFVDKTPFAPFAHVIPGGLTCTGLAVCHAVGSRVTRLVGFGVGFAVGLAVGLLVGQPVVGFSVGLFVGRGVGLLVGLLVGHPVVGLAVGLFAH